MLSERSHTQKDTQGVTPLRRNVQSSAWGLVMEADTEGVTTCGVMSVKESHGEGLPEDHARPGPPRPLPAALRLGAELVHRVPDVVEVGLPLIMLQQGGQVGRRLGEVGHRGRDGDLSCCRQPGCRPKQAACPDFPTLRRDVDGAPLPQRSPGPRPTGSPTHAPRIEVRSKVSPSSSWEMPSGPRVSACMGKDSLSSTESACVRNPSRRDFRAYSLTSSLRITQFSWNPETEGAGDRGPRPPRGPRARSFWSRKWHERDGL
ncbi:uncharacterized protein LOC125960474 isoform X2 [Orcinus orca]|uniref:uncharacterized protein LOC125960474 isoform X2 n=1 Tax=Orcinus orca TaxID=9733 RepID=UPI0021111A45|nr:uncharacterized protein LOC125960474 isoform X2 [Orcinus orca]